MFGLNRKQYLFVGLGFSVLSFVLLFIGVSQVLGNTIELPNIIAYLVFSLLVGIVIGSLGYFNLKFAFIFTVLGFIVGFFEMYRAFIAGMTGWGDLIGILSLFMWVIVGLGLGLITQLGFYLYNKNKSK